jgi:hypothetical protein
MLENNFIEWARKDRDAADKMHAGLKDDLFKLDVS